jgi:hypothetical protein
MFRLYWCLLMGWLFLPYSLFSQDLSFWAKHKAAVKAREKYFADGYFFGEQRVLDTWQSPLIYSGSSLGYSKAYISRSKGFYKEITLQFFFSPMAHSLSAPWGTDLTRSFYPQFFIQYLPIQIKKDSSLYPIWLGLSIDMGWQFRVNDRLQNSAIAYEFWLPAIGPSMRIERAFSFRERNYRLFRKDRKLGPGKFKAYASLTLPLIAWASRPPYSSLADYVGGDDLFSTAWDQRKAASLGSYRRVLIDWGIWWQGRERRSASLGYRWEFYQIDRPGHRVQSGTSVVYVRFHSLFRP